MSWYQISSRTYQFSRRPILKASSRNGFSPINHALMTGEKRSLSKKEKKVFKELNMMHLFTPSGLHFYPFYFLLIKVFSRKIAGFFLLGLLLATLSLPQYFALKRILALKSLYLLSNLSLSKSFFAIFLLDFIFGSFRESPLSFIYSFAFLGVIYTSKKNIFINILIAQIVISTHLNQAFDLLKSLSGIALSSLYAFFYPILSLNYWVESYRWQITFNNKVTEILKEVAQAFLKLELPLSNFELILLFAFLITRKEKAT